MKLTTSIATLGIFFSTLQGILLFSTDVSAVSPSDFQPGRIVDDGVFYNKDAMGGAANVQNFINSHTPTCDTWGTQPSGYGGTRAQYASSMGWPGPPYVCLQNYHENPSTGETSFEKGGGAFAGGQSAGQIIWDAAQKYGINPQVLLVMLKKESAGPLFSDSWPLKSQYKYAMGYACPDSGPNYSANCESSKAGFYNQMDLAAWQLRRYADYIHEYNYQPGRWNYIQHSPDPACGGQNVYIENVATASLYIYTPYVPTTAALNAYPGTVNCGAYGNRNFFMFFNEWFGSTLNGGDLVTDGSSGIYYVSKSHKHYVPSMAEYYNLGYDDADLQYIKRVSSSSLQSIPDNPSVKNVSVLISTPSQGIFLVSNGYKYYIPSMELFYAYGFNEAQIMEVNDESANRFITAKNNLNSITSDPRGFTYRVEGGERRGIFQPYVLSRYPEASTGSKLSDATLSRIRPGIPVVDGKLSLTYGNQVYLTVGDAWYSVSKKQITSCNGATDNLSFNATQGRPAVSVYTLESCLVEDQQGNQYLLDGKTKYKVANNGGLSFMKDANYTHFTSVPTVDSMNIFANGSGIYELAGNKRRHIMSMGYVNSKLGATALPVLKTDSLSEIPKGANIYDNLTLLTSGSGGIYLNVANKLRYVGSMNQFYAYGFKVANIIQIPDSDMSIQEKTTALPGARVKDGANTYVISGGKKLQIKSEDAAAYGGQAGYADVDTSLLSSLATGTITKYVTPRNSSGIYLIENGTRRYITSWSKFTAMGGSVDQVTTIDDYSLKSFEPGANI